MKLVCDRVGTTFNLSAVQEDGSVQRITYDWSRDVAIEILMAPKIEGKDYPKLREFLGFVKKTCAIDTNTVLEVNKWEGSLVIDTGYIDPKRPLRVVTKKLFYDYESVSHLLLDGWR